MEKYKKLALISLSILVHNSVIIFVPTYVAFIFTAVVIAINLYILYFIPDLN